MRRAWTVNGVWIVRYMSLRFIAECATENLNFYLEIHYIVLRAIDYRDDL